MEVKAKPDINSLIKSAIREASNNNWEKAKKLNLVILNISKNNIETLNRLGISYMKLLDKVNATKCFQYVLKIAPNNTIAHKNLNKLQLNLAEYLVKNIPNMILQREIYPHIMRRTQKREKRSLREQKNV